MSLAPKSRLGTYEILGPLGAGGMGEVYRARDTRLDREVALKLLPAQLVGDEEMRRRFLREARAAASVTHPFVAALYDVGESEGTLFLAMELVAGETLQSLVHESPLSIRDAVRLGAEIAEGLGCAHRVNIIHRDVKPGNVMVRPDGHAKILDFGLAKLIERRDEAASSGLSRTRTWDEPTAEARILGTPAYMSPEQVQSEAVDGRSDIFSFGATLYEMVTGESPFRGRSEILTLTAVLQKSPPPASRRNPEVPAELDRILGKCLEKNPSDRYQQVNDVAVDLRRLGQEIYAPGPGARPVLNFRVVKIDPLPSVSSALSSGLIIGAILSASAGLVIGYRSGRTASPDAKRFLESFGDPVLVAAIMVLLSVSVLLVGIAFLVYATRHRTVRIQFGDDRDHEPLFTYLLTQMNFCSPVKDRETLVYRADALARLFWDPAAKIRVRDEGRVVVVAGERGVVRKLEKSLWAISVAHD